jgi:hypothetical protein
MERERYSLVNKIPFGARHIQSTPATLFPCKLVLLPHSHVAVPSKWSASFTFCYQNVHQFLMSAMPDRSPTNVTFLHFKPLEM